MTVRFKVDFMADRQVPLRKGKFHDSVATF